MSDVSKLKVNGVVYDIKDETARTTKLDKNLGAAEKDKFLKVGEDGNIITSVSSTTVDFSAIRGNPEDNVKLKQSLDGKMNVVTGSLGFSLGRDENGLYLEI